MRFLVTGGCGFIGAHLCDALVAAGHGVVVLDDLSTGSPERLPEGASLRVGRAQAAAVVREAMVGVDGCFHLAALTSVAPEKEDWLGAHAANQTATVAVLDAARTAKRGAPLPVVYASSAAVYGEADAGPLAESAPTRPLTAYGADKLGSELHARVAWTVHGVPTVGLRLFNVYGPGQSPASPYAGVIALVLDRLRRGEPVTVFGDGRQTRDFVHVGDVVRALLAAMAAEGQGARLFNVCTGHATTILEVVRLAGELMGRGPEIRFEPARAGDVPFSCGDGRLAARQLGFTATTALREGLGMAVAGGG